MSERASVSAKRSSASTVGPVACSIVSNNYLPFARVFARSFLEHNPEGRVFVCIVDRRHPDLRYQDEPFEVIFADELGIPNFGNFAFRYSILELNTAVKPFLLQVLHERTGCSQLCYFDPDILITDELSDLYRTLSAADVVLTPHILEPIDDKASPSERDFLLSGSYNLGFLGIRFHQATERFLSWWQDRLYRQCLHQVENGLFVDQRWMDLAPAFLEDAVILHDPGYNVAYWNLVHRRIEDRDGALWVGGTPLRFFHFSGFHPDRLDTISKYQDRFELAERPDLLPLFEDYRDRIVAEGYDELISLEYGYSEFDNRVPIPPAARVALQDEDVTGKRWPNPFDTAGSDSFFKWLKGSDHERRALQLPRLGAAIWSDREDLKNVFPDPRREPTVAFARWLVSTAPLECGVDEVFLESTRRQLKSLESEQRAVREGTATEFSNGVPVPRRLREILAEVDPEFSRWPRPLSVDVADSFFAWLTECEVTDPVRVPRIGEMVWRQRGDLQQAFPDALGQGIERFAGWLLRHGAKEERLADPFVAAVRESLEDLREHRIRSLLVDAKEVRSLRPFDRSLTELEIEWLMDSADVKEDSTPSVFQGRPFLPRLAILLHSLRTDVAQSFPDPLGMSRRDFAHWFVREGRIEHGIPRQYLRATLADMGRKATLASELRLLRQNLKDSLGGASAPTDSRSGAAMALDGRGDTEDVPAAAKGGRGNPFDTWRRKASPSGAADLSAGAVKGVLARFEREGAAIEFESVLDFGMPGKDDPGEAPHSGTAAPSLEEVFRHAVGTRWSDDPIPGDADASVAWGSSGLIGVADHSFACVWAGRSLMRLGSEAKSDETNAQDTKARDTKAQVEKALDRKSEGERSEEENAEEAKSDEAKSDEARADGRKADWVTTAVLRELYRVAAPGGGVVFEVAGPGTADDTSFDDRLRRMVEEAGGRVVVVTSSEKSSPKQLPAARYCLTVKAKRHETALVQSMPLSSGRPLRKLRQVAQRDWTALMETRDGRGRSTVPLNRFLRAYWNANDYLRRVFPLHSKDDGYRFVYWLALVNGRDVHLQDWLLDVDWTQFHSPVRSLTEPDEEPITLFQWLAWSLRPDLQARFSLSERDGRENFRHWMAGVANTEYAEDLRRIEREIAAAADEPSEPAGDRPKVPGAVGRMDPGVNLVQHPKASLGIREDTDLNALALDRVGVPLSKFQFFDPSQDPDRAREAFRYRANLIHTNADQMFPAFGELGPQLWSGRYTIGYWLWELPIFPERWHGAFDLVDEIWVPSRFVQEALAAVSPVPVLRLPYPVRAEPDPSLKRSDFGLPERSFLFLTTFDVSSYAARKNPMATVNAFLEAFPRSERRVGLVVKAANTQGSESWQQLKTYAESDPRIHLFDELMERRRLLALVGLCDSYVSLHRSEGFGRGPAEAMLLGKPVIVTGHSGNLDYSSPETACVVDCDLVPVRAAEYPYHEGQVWAEPDLDHAAEHMQRLLEDVPWRTKLAASGRRYVRRHYSVEEAGRRYRQRLQALDLLPR